MTVLHETIETPLAIGLAFDYVADFANAQEWDPGVASSVRVDEGPVATCSASCGADRRAAVELALHPGESALADRVEGSPEEGLGEPKDAPETEVGLVVDPGPAGRRGCKDDAVDR